MTDTTERARELLDGLRTTLAVDGYDIDIEPADPGIHVVVTAQPEACEECLVPMDVFRGIVHSMLEKGGLVCDTIEVTYPTVTPH